MKQFSGFPAKMDFTPLPNVFFSGLLPDITDMAELQVTLHIMAVLYRKKGYPRFVTHDELSGNTALMNGLKKTGKSPEDALRDALELAVERGTFFIMVPENGDGSGAIYLLNDVPGRQAVEKIESGELKLEGAKAGKSSYHETEETSDIFKLYEQNIGILTPIIADALRDAEKQYPENWIPDAIGEAVKQNKRKWSYISAILESWATEGRSDGTHQRHSEKTDPDKYIRGKYGHMVRR